MNVAKARRRWAAWHRYDHRNRKIAGRFDTAPSPGFHEALAEQMSAGRGKPRRINRRAWNGWRK